MGLTIAQTMTFALFASYLATSELFIGDVFGLSRLVPRHLRCDAHSSWVPA